MRMDGQIEAWWKYSAKHHAHIAAEAGTSLIFFSRDFIVCNIINYLSVVINIVYAFWNSSCMSLILSIFTYHRKHNFREFLSGWNFQFLGEWSGFLFAFIFKHISTYLFSFEKYLFYLTNQNANCVDIENIILQTKISAPVLKFRSKVSFSQQRKWIQRIFLSCLKCRKFDN